MDVYRVRKVYINRDHVLFPWCDRITLLANNLLNACRFRQRQLFTSVRKNSAELTENELEVINEFLSAMDLKDRPDLPLSPGWTTIEKVMKFHKNPDYYAEGLPRQSAQQILRKACQDMSNYFSARRKWKLGSPVPELPGYRKKGGHCPVVITNQDCTIREGKDGGLLACLPLAKKYPLGIGSPQGRLKQAEVCPDNGQYVICLTFEVSIQDPVFSTAPSRIAAIDFGVDNLMAVTANCGGPCLLYKGGAAKSVNQWYNKRIAAIMKEEVSRFDCPKNKRGEPRFVPTEESRLITLKRSHSIHDFMHKTAKHFVSWCVENRIDTIVAGVNAGIKQGARMGSVNNQNFVQLPFGYLRHCIQYLSQEQGIRYIEREESYTSMASFLDMDRIPTYGVDDSAASFSGRRRPFRHCGMYKKDGFRGLYTASDGTVINSDLNASANILRKEFPDAFQDGQAPDFSNVTLVTHPDYERITENRKIQKKNTGISRSKQKRLRRKNVIPLG